jgi:hypothetical protein
MFTLPWASMLMKSRRSLEPVSMRTAWPVVPTSPLSAISVIAPAWIKFVLLDPVIDCWAWRDTSPESVSMMLMLRLPATSRSLMSPLVVSAESEPPPPSVRLVRKASVAPIPCSAMSVIDFPPTVAPSEIFSIDLSESSAVVPARFWIDSCTRILPPEVTLAAIEADPSSYPMKSMLIERSARML